MLLARMDSRHPVLQMPPLGSRIVDAAAVGLLRQWIAEGTGPTPHTRDPCADRPEVAMKFPSTRPSSVLGASLLSLGVLLIVRSAHPSAQVAPPASAGASRLAHGEYLVKTGGCNDCHTPWKVGDNGPEPDMSRMLMGHPAGLAASDPLGLKDPWIGSANATMTSWSGPWGRSYTANLTPDRETGIGAWTERQFIDTIRSGRHWGNGRPLLPTMPWQAFRNLADDDLAAIFAYLQTVPAIRNKVPDPVIAPGPPPEPLPTTALLEDRARPCRSCGAWPLPRDGQGVRRLPHADEDGRERPRVRPDADPGRFRCARRGPADAAR